MNLTHDERMELDRLCSFKIYVHEWLDLIHALKNLDGQYIEEGCRIRDRLDWLSENCMVDARGKGEEHSTILYSSSLTDGDYLLLPGKHEGSKSCITCKCVHCENGTLLDAMTAKIGPDCVTVSALCEDCGKCTEVYFVGVGRVTTLNEGETCEPSEMPTKDSGNIT